MTAPLAPAADDDIALDEVFTHGVASFDPAADRVILWTRVAPTGGTLTWHLVERGPDDRPRGPVRSGVVPRELGEPCVSVDVEELTPGTDHLYWFERDGHRSPTGRTRTLPDGSPTSWRVALTCCADRSINHLTVYRAIAQAPVDLVLHLGDYIYETKGKGEHRHEPDHVCVTLDDYDRRYAQLRRDPAVLAMHLRHPMVAIWDDHDIADNAWRHGAKEHDPDEHGPWEDRLHAAAIARQRWLPARLADPEDLLRVWRSVRIGDLAELVVMDTRIDGRDEQAGEPEARTVDDPDRSLIGPAQRLWLSERIRDRSTRWCVLATQVTMSPMQIPVPVGTRTLLDGAPSGYGIVDGRAVCVDEWDGYPAERLRVARWLADRGGDALIVSGDVHSAWVFDGALAPGVRAVAPEFVAPGVSSTPLGRQLPRGWRKLASAAALTAEGARWFDLESWGFVVLDITPAAVTGSWHLVDATGTDPRTELAATWVVDHGSPGALRAVGPLRSAAEPPPRALIGALVAGLLGAVTVAAAVRRRRSG